MRQKVSLCLIKFSERDRKVKLALMHFIDIFSNFINLTAHHIFHDARNLNFYKSLIQIVEKCRIGSFLKTSSEQLKTSDRKVRKYIVNS